GALRGFGHPEACFVMERMMDALAIEIGADKAEMRFKNFIAPEEFPYQTATGMSYDSGDYAGCMKKILQRIHAEKWTKSKKNLERDARKKIGIGLAIYTETTGFGPTVM